MPAKVVEGKVVDSYRFSGPAAKVMQNAIPKEPQYDFIPWTPLKKPLRECRFSLLTTAGISLKTDTPFNMGRERQEPLWGDQSFRRIPSWATEQDVEINHIHINTSYAYQDLNVALPIQRFKELAAMGEIGELAPTCYSIMGYNTDPTELVCVSAPQIAEGMRDERVEVALLVPVWPICCRSVGLVQRVIEEAGISTICVNLVPDYSRAYGFPRVAALEYPFSLTLGRPGDREGQLQVIRAALEALVEIKEPGGVVHLPFEWPEDPVRVDIHPPEPSPIAKLIRQGGVSNPAEVLGQGRWRSVEAILGKGRKLAAATD